MTSVAAADRAPATERGPGTLAALTLGALGVVYGDIGTSPLYAVREVFHAGHVEPTRDHVLGVLSLIFWTLAIVVSLKYVVLVLRAHNNGEGGTMALMALAIGAGSLFLNPSTTPRLAAARRT